MKENLRISIQSDKMPPEDNSAYGEHYAFVFDGLGGTGGKPCMKDGERMSEARIASGAAAAALNQWADEKWEICAKELDSAWATELDSKRKDAIETRVEEIVVEISGALERSLRNAAQEWQAEKLPTTIAGWLTFPAPEGKTLAVAIWAGDSRCYTIDADSMKLYSQDDSAEAVRRDAMQDCMITDSLTMNNRLGLDMEWRLHFRCHLFIGPILLISCTDGFYHCSESPMHLEYYLRHLGADESLEDMQNEWKEFILTQNRFEDDSATLETIFINPRNGNMENSDEEDFNALRELLASNRFSELDSDYIKVFPQEGAIALADIDANIQTIAKKLCAEHDPYHFVAELRRNAIRLAGKTGMPPADMPCSQVIRQMKAQHETDKQKRLMEYQELEDRKKEEETRFNAQISKTVKWEPAHSVESPFISSELRDLLKQPNTVKNIEEVFWNLSDCISEINEHVQYLHNGPRSSRTRQMPRSKTEAFHLIEKRLIEVCALLNKQAEQENVFSHLSRIAVGSIKSKNKSQMLSEDEKKQLKRILLAAAKKETLANELPGNKMLISAEDMGNLFAKASAYADVCRELEDFESNFDAVSQPSGELFDEYWKLHPRDDARYLIEYWIKHGVKPEEYSFSPQVERRLKTNVDKLREIEANNNSMRKSLAQIREQKIALWEKYKPSFEAHNEPFVLNPSADGDSGRIVPNDSMSALQFPKDDADSLSSETSPASSSENLKEPPQRDESNADASSPDKSPEETDKNPEGNEPDDANKSPDATVSQLEESRISNNDENLSLDPPGQEEQSKPAAWLNYRLSDGKPENKVLSGRSSRNDFR